MSAPLAPIGVGRILADLDRVARLRAGGRLRQLSRAEAMRLLRRDRADERRTARLEPVGRTR